MAIVQGVLPLALEEALTSSDPELAALARAIAELPLADPLCPFCSAVSASRSRRCPGRSTAGQSCVLGICRSSARCGARAGTPIGGISTWRANPDRSVCC